METEGSYKELERRVWDIIAVTIEDIDAVMFDIEDGVVYIEGAVPTHEQRQLITKGVGQLAGVKGVVTCLATEHVLPPVSTSTRQVDNNLLYPAPVAMHYYSLS
jgi:hypothetical protein